MLRKSISVLVAIILVGLTFGPLDVARAQSSELACPPFNPAHIHDEIFLQSLSAECAKEYQKLIEGQGLEETTGAVTPTSTGSDTFGYTFDDTVLNPWVTATTNTGVTGDDVTSGPTNIGFNFPFYGLNYSQLYFNTNGGITFGSGSTVFNPFDIPLPSAPNNLVAPFWGDLIVQTSNGVVVNGGAIYSVQGGEAPNRFFVLEWRDVTTYADRDNAFSFEAILYENGNIDIQYQTLPPAYNTVVGIENSLGDEGLLYQKGESSLTAPLTIHFSYPGGIARVQVSPLYAGQFSVVGETNEFELTISNTGSFTDPLKLEDTYDLEITSPWTATLYAADGTTLLTDTDSDTKVDTGPVLQGTSVNIIAKINTPPSAVVGNANSAVIKATSSLDTGKNKQSTLQNAVPAPFAQIYRDDADSTMSLKLVYPDSQTVKKVTTSGYYGFGNEMSLAVAPNGDYIYVWSKGRCLNDPCTTDTYEIEYTILDHFGDTVRGVTKLTDNTGATTGTYDRTPSVVVAPNGAIGIVWQNHKFDLTTSNFNVYFAILNAAGDPVTGPTNITNNSTWDTSLSYVSPAIATSDDNHFTFAWEEDSGGNKNISYAVRDADGAEVLSPAALTGDNTSRNPVLNSLKGGKSILTWVSGSTATYAILNSDGTDPAKPATTLGTGFAPSPYTDAVLMPNGKIAAAWTKNKGVQFAVLDPASSYNIVGVPTAANNPFSLQGYGLSVTTNSSNDVIMTWRDEGTLQNLFYALGTSAGSFVTPPMLYMSTAQKIYTSYSGQGNAPLKMPPSVVSVTRANPNPTFASSVDFTVTFSDPVKCVDASDFHLTTSGVSAETVSVSGVSPSSPCIEEFYSSVYTVTVDTGTGTGTIRLDVVDDDSILDTVGNQLGGPDAGNGNYPSGETYMVDKISPTMGAFTATTPSKSFNVPVTFTASDNVAVAGYLITTSATPPAADAAGWVGTVPTSFTAPTVGGFTLYPWVKDAAGNVSAVFASPRAIVVDLPIVVSITRSSVNPTKGTSVKFTVVFNKIVTGVDKTDFALATTGISSPLISGVSGSGTTRLVTVSTGSGSGTLQLTVKDNDSIKDSAGTPMGGAGTGNGIFTTGPAYTVDKTKPVVASIVRKDAAPVLTSDAVVYFTVTFSEPVTGVDKADFKLYTSNTATKPVITSVTAESGSTYTVAVNTGIGSGSRSLRLDLIANKTIKDLALNILTVSFKTGQIYTVDKAPTVLSIVRSSTNPSSAATVKFTVKFSEAVTGVNSDDFSAVIGVGATSPVLPDPPIVSVTGSGTTWVVTVSTGTGAGTLRLDLIDNDSIKDTAGTFLVGAGSDNGSYTTGQVYNVL
ncbi:MAG: hypothetical protein HZB50_14680 [Chloroflexi bacterium]|nr:hypothetical protein [Chloroflexota bacterium]